MYNSLDGKKDNRFSPSKNEQVKSKYLTADKKKYYLAGIDQNFEQLREEQLQELTQILTTLKSEYDALIRKTLNKKQETQKLGQQIKMLEKMNARLQNKNMEKLEENSNLESIIEMKKQKKEEENFQKITMLHLIEKMREEVYTIRMEITALEADTKKYKKFYEKERIQENVIMDKVNTLTSKVNSIRNKNSLHGSNNNLVLRYYNNVIDQKWSFINSADERKEKQIKIAAEAKNDSQDKEEVEKRKILSLCLLYNKYLRKKMEKELKENATLEETFQTIKDITGSSNLKTMVDKIMSKDKNYNMHVAKVNEKENKMEIVKKDIKALEEQYQKLRNDFPDESPKDNLFATSIKTKGQNNPIHLDEDEEALLEEERMLNEELKLIQDKHKDVRLIYEKVTENIKNICKVEKRNEDITNNSFQVNNSAEMYNNSNNYELETSMNRYNTQLSNDDELVRNYKDHLEYTRKNIEETFLKCSKDQFIKMMKERGEKTETNVSNIPKGKSIKAKNSINKKNEKNQANKDSMPSTQQTSHYVTGYNEYDYSDDEIKEDDKIVKEEYDMIVSNYKKKEKMRLIEMAKGDTKEKKI